MSGDALAKAIESLVTWQNKYQGSTYGQSPVYPYVLLNTPLPSVSARSHGRTVHARELRVRATVVGFTSSSVRFVAQKVVNDLEGARVSVPGWNVGRIESQPNEQPIETDTDVFVTGFGNPMYMVLDFIVIASQVPTQ